MTLQRPNAAIALRVPLLLLTIIIALAMPAAEVRAESYMTVSDVPVDVTAKNAAAARDAAISGVQVKAFARLLRRLVPDPAEQARIHPSAAEIADFVQDFAVDSERTSAVRYIGRYSVRFRASRVRQYLTDQGIQPVGALHQVLLVPAFRGPNGASLWGRDNVWRAAWEQGGYGDDPVTLILPNGDAFDTGTVSADAVAAGDEAVLTGLMQRYRTEGVVVAEARPDGKGLTVSVETFDSTGSKGRQSMSVEAAAGEQQDKLLRRAVVQVAAALEGGWQQSIQSGGSIGLAAIPETPGDAVSPDATGAQAPSGPGTLYPIAMPIADIADWVAARNRLAAMPGVQRLSLDAVTRGSAAFTLDFAGDPIALQSVLASSGFVLVQTAPGNAAGPGSFALKRTEPVGATTAP